LRAARPWRLGLLAGLGALLVGPPCWAALSCSVSSSGLGFGTYDQAAATPDDSTANIAVTCTRVILIDPFRVDYVVSLNRGQGPSFAPRRMRSGGNRLEYNIYRDAGRAQVWGDGTNSTQVVAGTANFVWFQTTQTNNHTAYGRVPAGQDVAPGSYTDTIMVKITF
jgi:spore coat protein U-like protein